MTKGEMLLIERLIELKIEAVKYRLLPDYDDDDGSGELNNNIEIGRIKEQLINGEELLQ